MNRICRLISKMKTFLFRENTYSIYVINGVTWYRLEPKSPKFRFPNAVKIIMKKENYDGK